MKIKHWLGTVALAVAGGWMPVTQAAQVESPVACAEGPPQALVYGDHTTGCTIGTSLDQDNFTFTAVAGELIRLNVNSGGNFMDPRVTVFDPMGTIEQSSFCNDSCSYKLQFNAAKTGTYLIRVNDNGFNEFGSYGLHLERIPPVATAMLLPYDALAADTVNHSTDVDFFRFEGVSGSMVNVLVNAGGNFMDPRLEIRDPLGAIVFDSFCNDSCTLSSGDLSLTVTGDYLVVLEDNGINESGTYSIAVQCAFGPCFRQTRVREYIDASDIDYLSADDVAELHVVRNSSASAVLVESTLVFVMDTVTNAEQAKVYVFNDKWRPVGITTIDNNGTDALSVLAVHKSSGFIKVRTMDVATNTPLATVQAFPPNWDAISITRLPDRNADSVDEVGVTARRRDNGAVVIRTLDPLTGAIIDDTFLPTP